MEKNLASTIQRFVSGQPIMWIVLCGTFFAAFFPVMAGLTKIWSQSAEYSYGFAIIPLAAYIIWQKKEYLRRSQICGAWSGLLVAAGSLIAYLIANKGEMQTLASVSMVIFLWGVVIFLFGYTIFRISLFPLMIVFFMIPVPSQIISVLTVPLQLIVTSASVWLASMIGIPIIHEGNIIIMSLGTFEVVQACSGLRSIMTMLILGLLMGYLMLQSNILRGILLTLAIPIAVVVNILRVFTLIAIFHYLAVDLSKGASHTVLGLSVFGIAFGLFLLAGKGLSFCEK
jgi:exosortase